jgi:hypothetical protein
MKLKILSEAEFGIDNPLEDREFRRAMFSSLVDLDSYIHDVDKALKARRPYWVQTSLNKIDTPLQQLKSHAVRLAPPAQQAAPQAAQQSQQSTQPPVQQQQLQNPQTPTQPTSPQTKKSETTWLDIVRGKITKAQNPDLKQSMAKAFANQYVQKGGKKPAELIYRFLMGAGR